MSHDEMVAVLNSILTGVSNTEAKVDALDERLNGRLRCVEVKVSVLGFAVYIVGGSSLSFLGWGVLKLFGVL